MGIIIIMNNYNYVRKRMGSALKNTWTYNRDNYQEKESHVTSLSGDDDLLTWSKWIFT